MRTRFDRQLETLHVELIQMGAVCEDAIAAASQALLKQDDVTLTARKDYIENQSQTDIGACI